MCCISGGSYQYLSESVSCFKVGLAILNWESLHACTLLESDETHMLHANHIRFAYDNMKVLAFPSKKQGAGCYPQQQ